MGIIFFKMVHGSLESPVDIIIEVLDFLLMDIGETSHTQFAWGADVTEYYEKNPHLMREGTRTGVLHSHHSMATFFSREDVDDLVINTKDKEVDYYLSVIVNNRGEWISRIGFRMEEKGAEEVKVKFWASELAKKGWRNTGTNMRTDTVLCMIPLEVIDYGKGNEERLKSLTSKWAQDKKPQHFKFDDTKPVRNNVSSDYEDRLEEEKDILQGQLFACDATYKGGLDGAVRKFRLKVMGENGQIHQNAILTHVEEVCAGAGRIIARSEGTPPLTSFVVEELTDLYDSLVDGYVDEEDMKGLAIQTPRNDTAIELAVEYLDQLVDLMARGKEKPLYGDGTDQE